MKLSGDCHPPGRRLSLNLYLLCFFQKKRLRPTAAAASASAAAAPPAAAAAAASANKTKKSPSLLSSVDWRFVARHLPWLQALAVVVITVIPLIVLEAAGKPRQRPFDVYDASISYSYRPDTVPAMAAFFAPVLAGSSPPLRSSSWQRARGRNGLPRQPLLPPPRRRSRCSTTPSTSPPACSSPRSSPRPPSSASAGSGLTSCRRARRRTPRWRRRSQSATRARRATLSRASSSGTRASPFPRATLRRRCVPAPSPRSTWCGPRCCGERGRGEEEEGAGRGHDDDDGRGGGAGGAQTSPSCSAAAKKKSSLDFRNGDFLRFVALLWALVLMGAPWVVGASRITDNRHHPSDVVAGLGLGFVVAGLFFARSVGGRRALPAYSEGDGGGGSYSSSSAEAGKGGRRRSGAEALV